jgi:hypothetical protein
MIGGARLNASDRSRSGGSMAKKTVKKVAKTATKTATKKRARKAGQRELLVTPTMKAFAKRNKEGEFTEMDDVGRSLSADRRRVAKTTVKAGFGDQGDQPKRKRTAKKR